MKFQTSIALVAIACGAATACATASSPASAAAPRSLGDIKVTAVRPGASNAGEDENIVDFDFIVDVGRILLTSPGDPNTFDLTEEANGCLRGTVVLGRYGTPHPATPEDDNIQLRQICPVSPAAGEPAGTSSWQDNASKLTFSALLSADGKSVVVASGGTRGEFALGTGPAADELRKRPELIAAAFAYGYVPRADTTGQGADSDYKFVVASARR
jgi:hypothetical protein